MIFSHPVWLLVGLTQAQLETVIPKTDPAYVMIVNGKHRGQVQQLCKLFFFYFLNDMCST